MQERNGSNLSNGGYRYKAFGLHIVSHMLLPELVPAIDIDVEPDVRIALGSVPSGIADAVEKNDTYQVAEGKLLLRFPGVGSYYVSNGNCIVVEPSEQAEEHHVRLYLLGSSMGSLLLQRGLIPIHGSAVVFGEYCVVFTGECETGKSTISAAFKKRGFPILTDDIAAVSFDDDGAILVQPGYPQQKLWRDSAEAVQVDLSSNLPVFTGRYQDKFSVLVRKGFCQSPVPLAAVYELKVEGGLNVRRLATAEKLKVLLNNTYRKWFVDGFGIKADHFKRCLDIANRVAVSQLTRPEGLFCLEEQVKLVQKDLCDVLPPGLDETGAFVMMGDD